MSSISRNAFPYMTQLNDANVTHSRTVCKAPTLLLLGMRVGSDKCRASVCSTLPECSETFSFISNWYCFPISSVNNSFPPPPRCTLLWLREKIIVTRKQNSTQFYRRHKLNTVSDVRWLVLLFVCVLNSKSSLKIPIAVFPLLCRSCRFNLSSSATAKINKLRRLTSASSAACIY